MVRLTSRQREALIEKVPDVANLIAGSMFFGQFLTDRPFSAIIAMAGLSASVSLWVLALTLAKEDRR